MKQRPLARRAGDSGARKLLKPALGLALLVGSAVCANAWAGPGHHQGHHGHHSHHGHHGGARVGLGLSFGAPLFWPDYGAGWYGGPGWYGAPYYRDDVLVPVEPPVYIERGAAPAKPLWYFCSDPQGYYPYVKQCATDWRPVAPESVIR